MIGHAGLQRGEPVGIGRLLRAEQPVAFAHRGFVARAVVRMAGDEREREPVEEAPPLARRFGKQPVHRGRQPQHGQPLAERGSGGSGAIDADDAALGRGGLGAGADIDLPIEQRCHPEPAAAALPRHFGQRRAAQSTTGGEQRDRLQHIGLSCAIVARQHDKAGPDVEDRVAMVAEIGEDEAGQGHARAVAFPLAADQHLRNQCRRGNL